MVAKIRFARDLFSDSIPSQKALDEKIEQFHTDFHQHYYSTIMSKNDELITNASKDGLKNLFNPIGSKLDDSVYDISQNLNELQRDIE